MVVTATAQDLICYSTQDVAEATGIPVTTILAWERRYGVPRPQRSESGHRQYSHADVALLRAMRARTAEGVRARTAARELLDPDGSLVRPRPVLAAVLTEVHEIRCLLCGDTSGELLTQRTHEGSRARLVLAPDVQRPRLGPSGRPRCGRCGGDLYREPADSRWLPPFAPVRGVASGRDAA